MKLVIVESPTKAKTISRFLGKDFVIESSYGHVRDLPKSQLGVDVENNFTPKYIIPLKARKNVNALKQKAAKAEKIILATDEDREGEAIAWHLLSALNLEDRPEDHIERIVFHEITERAIKEALKNPREIDMHLVDAQQARRILDRLVGYKLSPFLWKKIRSGLSAGRVQSVAVRLVVEREREIQKFVAQEYWSVEAELAKKSEDLPAGKAGKKFKARLVKIGDKAIDRLAIKNASEAKQITDELAEAEYRVVEVVKKEVRRAPAPPFTTSTLQQESAKKLGFSAKQTMIFAQRLYETGFITYMRTDSLNIAAVALAQAQEVIKNNFGKEYCLDKPRFYQNKSKGAQEAHEAVRPTDLSRLPEGLGKLDVGQIKLYDLIWKRTLACQMQAAILDQTAVEISAGPKYMFRANGQVIKFDGFIKVYTETKEEGEKDDDSDYNDGLLPELSAGEVLDFINLIKGQHFTEPPPRYTDASLIKTLESYGVGRPSTYAPTLATIQDRGYVEKEDKKYKPTEIGFSVNDMLVENFPEVIDINFTSHIEEEFDQIAEGKMGWAPVIQEFYAPFSKNLKEKMASVEQLTETSDTPCPHCGKMMLIKFGRLGKFLACPDPESKVTLPLPEEAAKIKQLQEKTLGELCPVCGKPLEVKRGRFGYFLGCVDYPKCKGIMKIQNKTGFKCPACGTGDVVEKKSRGRGKIFYACSRFPDCAFLMDKKPENQSELDEALAQWKLKPPKTRGYKSKFKTK
ncbi:MAG: topoisomerase protein [Candidatus Giovannonibacteria bacterium GW2011_GWC2_44_9]|uniref:DNA topoisomerase 1 n=3 Tax=Candidatus Giovannoniibacteriota TaxID=1752738 RepID=A0A0G1IYP9_9BACT|nr:MAG: topoisomerase protein [Candidatus Giovannonibacteria bacterium GW2011_GWB1_44_23]KKT64098.1 MAG: topoisomerase protein [Candidatus Giovannonibacteria bacterium GW2011_GWA1_44_29]KKT83278.1 MAG: topoisomerase protein [Candidatus Giovannonibacteria bacterium GW2011_GWC2_44_9]KKT91948.1 MAG: topoisomerase protein [Parcubacteria group bacterium GW2011_GWC1_45_13]